MRAKYYPTERMVRLQRALNYHPAQIESHDNISVVDVRNL